jgi:hypothetical protein
VHPWFGHEVMVVSRMARGTFQVDRDGQLRCLPAAWLDVQSQEPLTSDGRAVLLAPSAALKLADWVAVRMHDDTSSGS